MTDRKEYMKKYHKEYWRENGEYLKEYQKEYRRRKKDKIIETSKEYYKKNKDKIKEYHKRNKDKKKRYDKEYIEKPKERIKEQQKEYRIKNKEKIKKYRINNKDKAKEYSKEYYKTHRHIYFNARYKRRARMKFTDIDNKWLKKLYEDTNTCEVCNRKMKDKSIDHILPLNVGGLHIKSNVRIICLKCNQQRPKNGSDIIQFRLL